MLGKEHIFQICQLINLTTSIMLPPLKSYSRPVFISEWSLGIFSEKFPAWTRLLKLEQFFNSHNIHMMWKWTHPPWPPRLGLPSKSGSGGPKGSNLAPGGTDPLSAKSVNRCLLHILTVVGTKCTTVHECTFRINVLFILIVKML